MTDQRKRFSTWWTTIFGLVCLASAAVLSASEPVDAGRTASAWVLFVFGMAAMVVGGLPRDSRRGEGH